MSHNSHGSKLEPRLRELHQKLSSPGIHEKLKMKPLKSKAHQQSQFGREYWTAVALALGGVLLTHLVCITLF
jgi:hypothetical protein